MGNSIRWDFRREGRKWSREEFEQRWSLTPEKFEYYDGKLFGNDDEGRLVVLGMLIENLGLDVVVRLGDPQRWREAVATRGELEAEIERLRVENARLALLSVDRAAFHVMDGGYPIAGCATGLDAMRICDLLNAAYKLRQFFVEPDPIEISLVRNGHTAECARLRVNAIRAGVEYNAESDCLDANCPHAK